jgi:protein SCO1/2
MRRTLIALAAAVTVVVAVIALRPAPRPAPAPIAQLPEFALVERDGSTVTRADLAGAPWIADFVFTRCAIYCPRLTVRMKELRERLPPAIRTVSFSVDPEHDTPEVLERYAEQWGIEGRSWLFLTGEREPMWRLVREGFLLPVEDAPEVEASPILHSNRFVLVDSAGRIRDTYDAFDDDALERILADLSALAAEEGG